MSLDPTDLPTALGDDDELALEDMPTAEGSEDDALPLEAGVPDKLYYRIGEVAQIVGVDAHVLRYWETEFKMKPHRSPSGQRLYRRQDLSRFLRIRRLLHDEGYTIAGARKILSGGTVAPAAPVVGAGDPARQRELLHRIEGLRRKIAAMRDEFDPHRRG